MTLFIPVGRLTADPTTTQSANGRSRTTFSLAVDTGVKDASDQKITNFLNVTAWGKLGELAQNNLHKGDAVSVTGKFCARPYESKKDGQTKVSLDLNVTDIDFLPGGKKQTQETASQADPAAQRRRRAQAQAVAETSDDDEMPF